MKKALSLTALSGILSVFTVLFSAVPLLSLRRSMSRAHFFVLTPFVGAALFNYVSLESGLLYALMVVMIAVFVELEEVDIPLPRAALMSMAFSFCVVGVGLVYWSQKMGINIVQLATEKVSKVVSQVNTIDNSLKVDADMLLSQIPSVLVMTLLVSFWVALLFEKRLSRLFKFKAVKNAQFPLVQFRVPDLMIWVLLASIVGSYFDFKSKLVETIATNFLNVSALLYFFQGLAVVTFFFRTIRLSSFWRALAYFFLISQLFLFVSLIGLVDYWLDFRRRLVKKSAERTGEV